MQIKGKKKRIKMKWVNVFLSTILTIIPTCGHPSQQIIYEDNEMNLHIETVNIYHIHK